MSETVAAKEASAFDKLFFLVIHDHPTQSIAPFDFDIFLSFLFKSLAFFFCCFLLQINSFLNALSNQPGLFFGLSGTLISSGYFQRFLLSLLRWLLITIFSHDCISIMNASLIILQNVTGKSLNIRVKRRWKFASIERKNWFERIALTLFLKNKKYWKWQKNRCHLTLPHLRFQRDGVAIHDECAISVMMDSLWRFLRWINPGLEYFKDEEIVFVNKTRVSHLVSRFAKHSATSSAGNGVNQSLEFIEIATWCVCRPCTHYRCQFQRRNGDHRIPVSLSMQQAVISAANDADNHRAQLKQLIRLSTRETLPLGPRVLHYLEIVIILPLQPSNHMA